MKNLISKFQERLSVSKENAIFRIVMMFTFIACFIAIIVVTLINFPYKKSFETKILVPNRNYEVVVDITEQGIELKEKKFYDQLSLSDTVFVCVKSYGTATFMVNKSGKSFYFKKELTSGNFFDSTYDVKNISFDRYILTITQVRSTSSMFGLTIIVPLLLLLLFFLLVFGTQYKEDGYGYNDKGKFEKKYLEVWF